MLLAGKFITVVYNSLTPKGVILGRVLHGGVDINQRMIEAGQALAHHHAGLDQYILDRYVKAQALSKQLGLGMWGKNH